MSEKFVEIKLSPAKLFSLCLKGRGHTNKWVADNLDLSQTYVSLLLNEKMPLSKSVHTKLNELLETNY